MHPSRIFDKPTGLNALFLDRPPLRVVGALPDYDEGVAYEGRLDIVDAIGDCRVELLENNLPPGHTVVVDNATKEVVVRWPAYTPPETHKPGIINWNFASGDLEGWIDRRGNSWRVTDYPRNPSDSPPPYSDGSMVALMEGVGRGDHILESIRYPATPGQQVSARSLWDQGPSNKDNNNLFTAIAFYRQDGSHIDTAYGDRIHDRTNKNKHWSSVSNRTPPGAAEKTVLLIAHRRNNRNRWISVSDVQTTGFEYPTGEPTPDKIFHLRIRVTDSANRVAYWSGIIASGQVVLLTSSRYPIVEIESIYSTGTVEGLDGWDHYPVNPVDSLQSTGAVMSMEMWVSQAFHTYDEREPDDAVTSTGAVVSLEMETTIQYLTYAGGGEESSITSTGTVQALSLEVTTNYVGYSEADAITSSGSVIGIEMQ